LTLAVFAVVQCFGSTDIVNETVVSFECRLCLFRGRHMGVRRRRNSLPPVPVLPSAQQLPCSCMDGRAQRAGTIGPQYPSPDCKPHVVLLPAATGL
jgi:hypothetical protein